MIEQKEFASPWMKSARQDRGQQTAERILTATEKLMAKRPFREISVAEIVREAEASQSSFYARFPDKGALLGCIYERHSHSQKALIDALLSLEHWRGVPLAKTLRATFPVIVAGYRSRQGLIRAFIDLASGDERFRKTWGEIGDHIVRRVKELVLARQFEVSHPDPEAAVEFGLGFVFANLAFDIQMHEIDSSRMESKVEQMILMMLRYMGIEDVEDSAASEG
ncbi:MAG: TetR/AcrR family transcriptional regulator [Planctomycetota bacterium]